MSFWTAVATLLLIMDPLGNVPAFAAILQRFSSRERMRIVIRELLIALVILMAFLHGGHYLLTFLGLSSATLGIAGGIILFLIALHMVFPRREFQTEAGDEEPVVVPLAVPLIAGPACAAMLMLLANSAPDRMLQWSLALLLSWLLCAVVLLLSALLIGRLNRRLLRAGERLMGMILIMLGAQMFLDGLAEYLNIPGHGG